MKKFLKRESKGLQQSIKKPEMESDSNIIHTCGWFFRHAFRSSVSRPRAMPPDIDSFSLSDQLTLSNTLWLMKKCSISRPEKMTTQLGLGSFLVRKQEKRPYVSSLLKIYKNWFLALETDSHFLFLYNF